jgi:alginate O-acetyltransferase complex protein AlgJ
MIASVPVRKWMALLGLTLVTIAAAPVNLHFLGVAQPPDMARHSLSDVVSGKAAHAVTRLYNDNFLFRDTGIDLFGVLSYALFGEGRKGVLIGADGYLFSAEEYETSPAAEENLRANIEFIARSAQTIKTAGALLIVAIVPAKARIYPEKTDGYVWPPEPASRLHRAVDLLRLKGLPFIDLTAALQNEKRQRQVFLKTDTHWTGDGAAAAADAIAAALPASADLGEPARVQLSVGAPAVHHGDLMRYVRLGPLASAMGPAPDTLVTAIATVESGETLLGDTDIPVALVGTSYSADPRWSFRAHLASELQRDVLDVASQGEGPFKPMSNYLGSANFRQSPPKLVIWEIPERFLDNELEPKVEGNPHG